MAWNAEDNSEISKLLGEYWPGTFRNRDGTPRMEVLNTWIATLRSYRPAEAQEAIRSWYLEEKGTPKLPDLVVKLRNARSGEGFVDLVWRHHRERCERNLGPMTITAKNGATLEVHPEGLYSPASRKVLLWNRQPDLPPEMGPAELWAASDHQKAVVRAAIEREQVSWGAGIDSGTVDNDH